MGIGYTNRVWRFGLKVRMKNKYHQGFGDERDEAWNYSFVGKLSGSKRQNLEKKISMPGYKLIPKTIRLHVDLSDKTTQLFKISSACKNLTILYMIHSSQIMRSTDSIYKYKSRVITVCAGEIRIEDPKCHCLHIEAESVCWGRGWREARSQRRRKGMLRGWREV